MQPFSPTRSFDIKLNLETVESNPKAPLSPRSPLNANMIE